MSDAAAYHEAMAQLHRDFARIHLDRLETEYADDAFVQTAVKNIRKALT